MSATARIFPLHPVDGNVAQPRAELPAHDGGESGANVIVGSVKLVAHTAATGGMLVISNHPALRLTPIQFGLLRVLARQLADDEKRDESVRGFVSSGELLCSLPWDSPHPDLCHLKQLVRRLRRRLVDYGVDLEACCGLGYRLAL